jgi:hypothetical protein
VTNYVHMTALAVRHETGTRRRFERESRMTQIEHLRERIARDEYAVDADKVADAIVRRLGGAQRDIAPNGMNRLGGAPGSVNEAAPRRG